jgi:SUMO ligase MMS21 Smc5/6 complex component
LQIEKKADVVYFRSEITNKTREAHLSDKAIGIQEMITTKVRWIVTSEGMETAQREERSISAS